MFSFRMKSTSSNTPAMSWIRIMYDNDNDNNDDNELI